MKKILLTLIGLMLLPNLLFAAAYTATITLDDVRVERLGGIGSNLIYISGTCNLSNYNQTGAEITDITKYTREQTLCLTLLS